jgi:Flp pilus assembly protein TadD
MSQSSDSKLTAVELKAEGNEFFRQKKYDQAAIKFTKAIDLDRSNAVLYANRAACHLALKRFVFAHNINFNQTFDDF